MLTPIRPKPFRPMRLDVTHPYARGLVAAWIFSEGQGSPFEFISRTAPSATNNFAWAASDHGFAAQFNGTNSRIAYSTIPSFGPAMSFAGRCNLTNVASGNCLIERSTFNNTWDVFGSSSVLTYRGGNSSARGSFSLTGLSGTWFSWCFADAGLNANAPSDTKCYLNGASITNTAGGGALSVANTNTVYLGAIDGSSFFMGGMQDYVYVWNYQISARQAADIAANPWQIFAPVSLLVPSISLPGIAVSPTSIYADNPSGLTLTLSGFGTSWNGGSTTFTVSGVSGVSKTAQNVTSTTAATVNVTTGAGTGTLVVSDGTYSTNVPVLAPTITASPANIPAHHTGNITITLTGGGTSWSGGTTTFTVSGVSGTSKVSQSISSTTSASLVVATGSGTGTLTISDGYFTTSVNIVTQTFTLSSTSGIYSAPRSLTITGGTGSIFTQETASGLFTVPGLNADLIDSINVTNDNTATIRLIPGTRTTSTTITHTPTGATATYTINGVPGSVHITGAWQATTTGSPNIVSNQATLSVSFMAKFTNASPSGAFAILGQVSSWFVTQISGSKQIGVALYNSSNALTLTASASVTPGAVYHVALTWSQANSRARAYVNGVLVGTASVSTTTGTAGQFRVGNNSPTGTNDYQLSQFAVWQNYELTQADAYNLRDGVYIPTNLIGSASGVPQLPTTCWLLGATTSGTPSASDAGFTDIGTNGTNHLTSTSGTAATYDAALTYTAPVVVTPYVAKSGKIGIFGTAANGSTSNAVTGTVSVARNSTALTTSVAQPTYQPTSSVPVPVPWIGSSLTISGDSSNTVYKIVSGYGTTWKISPAYAGSTNAVNAGATLIQAGSTLMLSSMVAIPTIQVQFGGTGSFQTIQKYGPVWTPVGSASPLNKAAVPFAAWLLQCGPIESIRLNGVGSSYSSPSVSASGGGGSGATFGTPLLTGGVTSYTVGAGGSGFASATASVSGGAVTSVAINAGGASYSTAPTVTFSGGGGSGAIGVATTNGSAITGVTIVYGGTGYVSAPTVSFTSVATTGPAVTVAAPSLAITGTISNGSTSVTSVSSTTGIVPGMAIVGTGTYPNTITAVGSTTLTLQRPAVGSGAKSLTVVGKQAMALVTVAGGAVTAVTPFVPGSGYSGSTATVTLSGGGGTGASITGNVTKTIGLIPVTNGGSGYTSPPTISITDGTGTGAVAIPVMGGVQPSDNVTYTVSEDWLTAGTSGGAPLKATSTPMTNYSGSLEAGFGGLNDFNMPSNQRIAPIGMNFCAAAINYLPTASAVNWIRRIRNVPGSNGVVTITPDRRPLTISGTSGSPTIMYIWLTNASNGIDNTGFTVPIADGANNRYWTFVADELTPANPTTVSMVLSNGTVTTASSTSGTLTTGVNTIAVANGGTGYTAAPTVTITGGGGSGASAYAMINSNGQVYWINIISPGSGYTSTPTITITGGGGSGATATLTTGSVAIGKTWLFTAVPGTTANVSLALSVYKSTGGTYPYTLVNEYLFGPQSTAQAAPSTPTRTPLSIDPVTATMLTTSTPKYPDVLRFMGSEMVYALSNAVDPSDLISPFDYSWYNPVNAADTAYLTPNPTGSRILNLSTIRTYSVSSSCIAAIYLTARGTGYTSAPTIAISGTGTGATATATVGTYGITAIAVSAGGSSYTSAPSVTISGGGGSGAQAIANLTGNSVSSITVVQPGSGYTSTPTITFSGGGGSGATAGSVTTSTTTTVIATITVTNGGSGYTGSPTVTISGGGGSGATASATIGFPSAWGVNWSSPNVYFTSNGTNGNVTTQTNAGWQGYGVSGHGGGPYYIAAKTPGWPSIYGPASSFFAAEFVTSTPHSLKTGQHILLLSNNSTFSVSSGSMNSVSITNALNGLDTAVYVTGDTSFMVLVSSGTIAGLNGGLLPGAVNNVAGTFSVNYTGNVIVPDNQAIPYETLAATAANLPGCDMWTNVPWAATDACVLEIANRVLDHFPPGRRIIVEYANEHWNAVRPTAFYLYAMSQIGFMGTYTNTSSTVIDEIFARRTGQVHQIFENAAAARGRTGEIYHLMGGAYPLTSTTTNMLATGVRADGVCVANYVDPIGDVTDPTNPTTVSVGAGSTSLPTGTYSLCRTWVDTLTGLETSIGVSRTTFTTTVGSPLATVTMPTYPTYTPSTGNIYLSPAGGGAGSETLYMTGITGSTVALNSATWSSPTTFPPAYNQQPSMTLAAASLATHWPTSIAYQGTTAWSRAAYLDIYRHYMKYNSFTSFALSQLYVLSQYSGTTPQLVFYEGDLQTLTPPNIQTGQDPKGFYLRNALSIDLYYDPAIYDWEQAYYQFCQQFGAQINCPFFLAGLLGNVGVDGVSAGVWAYTLWDSQPKGKGDGSTASNGLAMTNQFWADTQIAEHSNNASARMQSWSDWADAANDFVIPGTVSVTPANGSTGVSPRVVIVAEFDEPMLASTINATTWTVKHNGASVPGAIAYDPITWTATFTPTPKLSSAASYVVQLTTGVENAQGIALSAPITWSFQTGSGGQTTKRWYPGLNRRRARLTQ